MIKVSESTKGNNANTLLAPVYSQDEVKTMIQMIYSEFAELPLNMHTTHHLRMVIEKEVEQHPLKPIKIFKQVHNDLQLYLVPTYENELFTQKQKIK